MSLFKKWDFGIEAGEKWEKATQSMSDRIPGGESTGGERSRTRCSSAGLHQTALSLALVFSFSEIIKIDTHLFSYYLLRGSRDAAWSGLTAINAFKN